jgi:hypothetical protein
VKLDDDVDLGEKIVDDKVPLLLTTMIESVLVLVSLSDAPESLDDLPELDKDVDLSSFRNLGSGGRVNLDVGVRGPTQDGLNDVKLAQPDQVKREAVIQCPYATSSSALTLDVQPEDQLTGVKSIQFSPRPVDHDTRRLPPMLDDVSRILDQLEVIRLGASLQPIFL